MANITNININGTSYGVGQESTGGSFYVPDRIEPPTEETLSYVDEDNAVVFFSIGQMCRVYDNSSARYVFYQFQGNVSGKAEWRQIKDSDSSSIYAYIKVVLKTDREENVNFLDGTRVTITDITTSEETYSTWYGGDPIVFRVYANKPYDISVSDVSGYITPESEFVFAASYVDRDIEFTYQYMDRSYIDIYFGASDPAAIYGDVNKGVIAELVSEFRRCLVKKTHEGEVTICYLHDIDGRYFHDGTSASGVYSTYGVDTMVYFPEYYYKIVKDVFIKDSIRIYISKYKVDDEYIHVPSCLVGAYKAVYYSGKMVSYPSTNVNYAATKDTFKSRASARGTGYQIIDYNQHCTIALFLYAKYGRRDLRNVLGSRETLLNNTGWSISSGVKDSDSNPNPDYGAVGLCLENVYDGGYEIMDGITFNRNIYNNTYTITNLDGSTRTITKNVNNTSGYIKNILAEEGGSFFDVLPTNNGGSSNIWYTDYFYGIASADYLLTRASSDPKKCGPIALYCFASNNTSSDTTSRLAFRGIIIVEEDVEAFKALPVII
nr:MAG TPA: hypothetical protein [Siphoviridae sp. ctDlU28]